MDNMGVLRWLNQEQFWDGLAIAVLYYAEADGCLTFRSFSIHFGTLLAESSCVCPAAGLVTSTWLSS